MRQKRPMASSLDRAKISEADEIQQGQRVGIHRSDNAVMILAPQMNQGFGDRFSAV